VHHGLACWRWRRSNGRDRRSGSWRHWSSGRGLGRCRCRRRTGWA